jgi:glucose-6-phosphate 1-dehydrogenase
MSASSPADDYETNVNRLLDNVRKELLTKRPSNVAGFVQRMVANQENLGDLVDSCDRIVPRYSEEWNQQPLTIVVLGASGDLAKKKTFPALFSLYCEGLLPSSVQIVGYARTKFPDVSELHAKISGFFSKKPTWQCHKQGFLRRISYLAGSYDRAEDFAALDETITRLESGFTSGGGGSGCRLFYLALPPTAFVNTCAGIRGAAMAKGDGWTRVIVEKPFGRDTASSDQLSRQLGALFTEQQIYRIDHYLGKEMVQNIVTLRFANKVFANIWDTNSIAYVQITFKEKIGTEGRGGYFDEFGIIRDVVQNHLTQILALVTMEKPRTLNAEDIRNEKVNALRYIQPVQVTDCVLGQYTAGGSTPGYLEDPTVPKGSNCPTFACMRIRIDSDRWRNVPFVIKAGKALEDKQVSIRIQFHEEIRPFLEKTWRNELVIRAQPEEAMYLKITTKVPGIGQDLHQTELDLSYGKRYGVVLPEAYESLINEAILGNSTNFVRSDELEAAWRIFTPLLHAIDRGELKPLPYAAGTRGPAEADELIARSGFRRTEGYVWQRQKSFM